MAKTKDGLLQILALAMEREDEGHQFYLDAADKTTNEKGKKMFQWLAEEERKHYNKLSVQRKELSEGRRWKTFELGPLPMNVPEFSRISEAVGTVKPDTGELDALKIGINAEKESIALYSKGGEETDDPEGKAMFQRLVQEEQGHLDLLESEYEWLRKSKEYLTIHRFNLPPA